ncbi:MAG: putative DNA base hypermodification protein [Pirellulales bacterium]
MNRKIGSNSDGGKGIRRAVPRGFSKLAPAKPSHVYDTYWKFAVKRQQIFVARAKGEHFQTSDCILAKYKFTNAYRASDRVSQYLIQKVLYEGEQSAQEIFFRTLLFKFFNRIDTWETLTKKFGMPVSREFDPRKYGQVLESTLIRGVPIYSAAYIMPSGGKGSKYDRKHEMHLALLARMVKEETAKRLQDCARMRDAFVLLRSFPTIGDFLAYQYVTDLNYSSAWNYSEMEFVVPGPGALDGLQKCFHDRGGLTEADLIRIVTDRQEREFERLGLTFPDLWGRSLQLIDCQNLFCEISKYARIAHPEVAGITNRTRIKQVYSPNPEPIALWYPPKWGLNDRLPR